MKAINGLGGSLIGCLRPAHIVATAPPGWLRPRSYSQRTQTARIYSWQISGTQTRKFGGQDNDCPPNNLTTRRVTIRYGTTASSRLAVLKRKSEIQSGS
jgi:hypothetical protein